MLRLTLLLAWLHYPGGVSAALEAHRGQCADLLCQIHRSYPVNMTYPMVHSCACFDEHDAMVRNDEQHSQTAYCPVVYAEPEPSRSCINLPNDASCPRELGPDPQVSVFMKNERAMIEDFVTHKEDAEHEQHSLMERWHSSRRDRDRSAGPRDRNDGAGNRTRSVRATTEEVRHLAPIPRRRSEPETTTTAAEAESNVAHELVEDLQLWRWMLDLESTSRHPDLVMLPAYVKERIRDNLKDKDMRTRRTPPT